MAHATVGCQLCHNEQRGAVMPIHHGNIVDVTVSLCVSVHVPTLQLYWTDADVMYYSIYIRFLIRFASHPYQIGTGSEDTSLM